VIPIGISSNVAKIIGRAKEWPARVLRALAKTLDRENELTTAEIQANNLSRRGSSTLGVVTNRLRSSARPSRAVITGQRIESAIGSNVIYAGVHEFGFRGMVTVRAHLRRNPRGDVFRGGRSVTAFLTKDGHIRRKRARPVAEGVSRVKAHTMQMNMPARAPFRSGVEDRLPAYRTAASDSLYKSWKGDEL
jgi:phage gpG-like protein